MRTPKLTYQRPENGEEVKQQFGPNEDVLEEKMRVILHIGLPKTGSSYLQEWLRINPDVVACLPLAESSRLATECCDMRNYSGRPDFSSINEMSIVAVEQKLFDLRRRDIKRVIISSEYFYLARPSAIRAYFENLDLSVEKIICFFRRQDDLLASGYAQDVKALSWTEPFDLDKCRDLYDWLQLKSEYEAAFPEAAFSPLEFDYLRSNKTLLSVWKSEIGCTTSTLDLIPGGDIVNASLPGKLVEVFRIANQTKNKSVIELLQHIKKPDVGSSPYRLPLKDQAALWERYSERNDLFVATMDDPKPFDHYTSANWKIDEVEMIPDLSPEMVVHLLTAATSELSATVHPRRPATPYGHGHGLRAPNR